MKVIVTGANGQLGTDLCKALHDTDVVPLTHADVEIVEMASVREAIIKHKPDVIINTAAYVRVDDCEINRDKAYRVNALGARNVAVVAQELGAKLVHISTDYVFGGERHHEPHPTDPLSREAPRGYPGTGIAAEGSQGPRIDDQRILDDFGRSQGFGYTEFDIPVPANIYGASKLAGEDFVRHLCTRYFIIRASGLFGTAGSSGKGGNFVETMLRLGKERDELRVVNDQIFSPTYTKDLAAKIAQLMPTTYYGIFHITNRGTCSWYEFTREIIKLAGLKTRVTPIASEEYPQKAPRPAYSVLAHYHLQLLGMDDMRGWEEALKEYLVEKKQT